MTSWPFSKFTDGGLRMPGRGNWGGRMLPTEGELEAVDAELDPNVGGPAAPVRNVAMGPALRLRVPDDMVFLNR